MGATTVLTEPSVATLAPALPAEPAPTTRVEFDPFVAPTDITDIARAAPRSRVALRGRVTSIATTLWAGGTALEVTLDDGSDAICLTFLGRRRIAGIDLGRQLTAGATIVQRRGRRLLMNPHIWLHAS
jgi:hypothetical protein